MVAIMLGADNGFFYAGQVMHFSSPFTVFLIYHKHAGCSIRKQNGIQDYLQFSGNIDHDIKTGTLYVFLKISSVCFDIFCRTNICKHFVASIDKFIALCYTISVIDFCAPSDRDS